MAYTVAKQNVGTPRTFKTRDALARAIYKAGATDVHFSADGKLLTVVWRGGYDFRYAIDENDNIEQQLAWDMEVSR